MSETEAGQSGHLPRTRLLFLLLHSAQLALAIAVLGLDSYGLLYVQYNVLIYSLTVAICTLLVCPYLLASQVFSGRLYNVYISIGLHVWMIVFWAVATGLVADLAKQWSQPECTYTPQDGYSCSSVEKRDLKVIHRRNTSYHAYSGALVAGATLAGLEILVWVCTTALLLCNVTKRHPNTTEQPPSPVQCRPAEGDIEKQRIESNIWDAAGASIIREGPQPLLPPASPEMDAERTETYPFPGRFEQPPKIIQMPHPWARHQARVESDDGFLQPTATGPVTYYVGNSIDQVAVPDRA